MRTEAAAAKHRAPGTRPEAVQRDTDSVAEVVPNFRIEPSDGKSGKYPFHPEHRYLGANGFLCAMETTRNSIFRSALRYPLLLAAGLSAISCRVEYHPYDTRVEGACGINARNIARIESATKGRHTLRFAVISDTQRWYDETRLAMQALNRLGNLDFVLHTGDLADFGMRTEFERQRDILETLRVPYVVAIGNHDCLATGEKVFRKIFGAPNFAFTAGDIRFVCLNTNSLEYDHSAAVPDFEFIKQQPARYPARAVRTVVAMHAPPYSEQFDNNVAQYFQQSIRALPDLQFCVHGHGHRFAAESIFDDGIVYYECPNIEKRTYLLFTVDETGYAYECVDF